MPATFTRPAAARRLSGTRLRLRRAGAPRRPSHPQIVLGIILTCQLMLILDVSIIITSLPRIHRALGFSPTGLSWVQNAYALTFGGLLLLGARAGDILGRRRMFVAGLTVFTAASLAGGLAQSPGWLLGARAVQGLGAAVAAPSTLALLSITFREGRERTRAVASYSAVSAAGGSIGLVVGGMLTSWASWRWGLFINVPIGIVLVTLAPRFLPESERHDGRFDLTGAITSTLGMTAIVYGFVRAASDGWGDLGTVASFAAGVLLLAAFVLTERRAEQPITPLRMFASRERSGAYVGRLLLVAGNFSSFFFLTQYFQGVRGFSAVQTGIAFLPMTLAMFASVRIVPRLTARFGTAPLLIGGLTVALAGMLWLTRITEDSSYVPGVAVAMVVFGAGTGIAMAPLTSVGMAGVPARDAGAGSGLLNAAQQVGAALGLGILVTVFASSSRSAAQHAGATPRSELAHAVASTLVGSAGFLVAALAVAVVIMWPRMAAARATAAAAERAS
ncbi:MFS transporter [Baekduia soli]|uniref:MFS transporter n=1 Tax=Baekduia soli TaxID=496014 RepID=A0A5B8U0K4_9ACTN|nr:MFS transporter [Baekduia soli]QEC46472.1 MFS transporter [Baekduia soli]